MFKTKIKKLKNDIGIAVYNAINTNPHESISHISQNFEKTIKNEKIENQTKIEKLEKEIKTEKLENKINKEKSKNTKNTNLSILNNNNNHLSNLSIPTISPLNNTSSFISNVLLPLNSTAQNNVLSEDTHLQNLSFADDPRTINTDAIHSWLHLMTMIDLYHSKPVGEFDLGILFAEASDVDCRMRREWYTIGELQCCN